MSFRLSAFILVFVPGTLAAQSGGTLAGVVKEDSTGRPVSGAEVSVEAVKRQTMTDAEGRFRLSDVSAGVRMVTVKKLGYLPSGLMVQFLPNDVVEKTITVSRAPAELDTVRVADRGARVMVGRDAFDDRRKLGFGHFFDSTALRKLPVLRVSDLLQSENGVGVVRPPMCTGIVNDPRLKAEQHHYNCSGSPYSRVAVSRGLCGMKVMLDGNVVGAGGQIDPKDERYDPRHNWIVAFDVASVDLGSMEKIEVYRRSEDVPLEFKSHDTECGLLLLWTRR